MPLSTAQKFRIKEGMKILTINAPTEAASKIQSLCTGLQVGPKMKGYQQIHWFVRTKEEMEKELTTTIQSLRIGVICWIHYPKGSSRIQTNLTRDKGWESLLKHEELQWISLLSFDETWSAFGMRLSTAADKKKTITTTKRPIEKYIDPVAKTVRVPEDLGHAMKKNKQASSFYEKLSYTNRKEYVEWVITAKREETRKERIAGTIQRLEKSWKNPRNL
jgi:hypothetical protein